MADNDEQLGPYELDDVYCGDAAVLMAALPDECIDLTVTSPPYDLVDYDGSGRLVTYPKKGLRDYNGYSWDFVKVARQLYRVTKQGGVVVWVVADETRNGSETGSSFRQALYFQSLGFGVETMIYEVMGTGAKGSNYYYWQAFEYMFVFSKGQPRVSNRIQDRVNLQKGKVTTKGRIAPNGHEKDKRRRIVPALSVRTNIWQYHAGNNGEDVTGHPAPFPEALARDHIVSWSQPGDVVLDPFMGSGTVAKMAMQQGRRYLGFDVSQEYVELSKRRVAWANPPLLVVS